MRRPGVVIALATVLMLVAALPTFVLAVSAPDLMRRFGVGTGAIGLLVSLIYASAALLARRAGDFVDRRGDRRAGQLLLLLGGLIMLAIAIAPAYGLLAPASVLAGVGLALSNPVTNVSIRRHVRGRLLRTGMGIKQAGVPAAVLLAGAALPGLAGLITWRGVALALAVLALAAVPFWTGSASGDTASWQPRTSRHRGSRAESAQRYRPLRTYALVLGCLAGLLNTFCVLYAVEHLHMSGVAGGWVAAVLGLTGAAARWVWVEVGGRSNAVAPTLGGITVLALLGTAAMWASYAASPNAVWVGAVLLGLSVMGWQGVVMHAVTADSSPDTIGEESALIMQRFYSGLLATPFITGWAIESMNSYAVLWTVQSALVAIAFVPVVRLWTAETPSEVATGSSRRHVLTRAPGVNEKESNCDTHA